MIAQQFLGSHLLKRDKRHRPQVLDSVTWHRERPGTLLDRAELIRVESSKLGRRRQTKARHLHTRMNLPHLQTLWMIVRERRVRLHQFVVRSVFLHELTRDCPSARVHLQHLLNQHRILGFNHAPVNVHKSLLDRFCHENKRARRPRQLPVRNVIKCHTKRPNVRSKWRVRLPAQDFRCRVRRRARERAELVAVTELADPEVGNPDSPMGVKKHVLGLDISVRNSLLMNVLNAAHQLLGDVNELLTSKRAVFLDAIVERSARAIFEDKVEPVVNLEEVVEADDVDVVEAHEAVHFGAEEGPVLLVLIVFHDLRAEDLLVLLVVDLVDLREPALADLFEELVAIDLLTHKLGHVEMKTKCLASKVYCEQHFSVRVH